MAIEKPDFTLRRPIAESLSNVTAEVTVEAWLRVDAQATTLATVVGNFGGVGVPGWRILYVGAGNIRFQAAGVSGGTAAIASFSVGYGTWYHVVGRHSASTMTCWVNGGQYVGGTSPAGGPLTGTPAHPINFFGDLDTTAYRAQGGLGLVRVWDRVLSDGEVRALYLSKSAARIAGAPIHHWDFRERPNGLPLFGLYDKSGNGNHGTLLGWPRTIGSTGGFDNFSNGVNHGIVDTTLGSGTVRNLTARVTGDATVSSFQMVLGRPTTSNAGVRLMYNHTNFKWAASVIDGSGSVVGVALTTTAYDLQSQTVMVSAVYTDTQVKTDVYDTSGTLVSTSGWVALSSAPTYISDAVLGDDPKGSITWDLNEATLEDVRWHDSALSTAALQALAADAEYETNPIWRYNEPTCFARDRGTSPLSLYRDEGGLGADLTFSDNLYPRRGS